MCVCVCVCVEGGEKLLVVKLLRQNVQVNERVVSEVVNLDEVDEKVHVDASGGNDVVVGPNGGQEYSDFDWLEEGFERLDFDDGVFGSMDARPST